ncbi:uncharacterized protein GLRG_10311 [Colletotrichum graminicola M1.001]|uniref:F-box domain-containing protein n=1 Tax=Colletotrichum graminicola (strain M1.001 / M2 / FGSC 10212) TaxID=645133 RepID=E3QWC9_COLGM|nr:uncharacterized protein GLRG_10311 [Colletotrichum graminicola M1.001]EFQ35167.1 hypothetical protein GLRG_10311 [Colletotrichum graminicola M1.001]
MDKASYITRKLGLRRRGLFTLFGRRTAAEGPTGNDAGDMALDPSALPLEQLTITCGTIEPANAEPMDLDPSPLDLEQLTITSGTIEPANAEPMDWDPSPLPSEPLTAVRCGPSPWESNFDRNRRQSRLIGLPDELLLQVMKVTEVADLYMLRQVSFSFWRIYRGRDFSEFNSDKLRPDTETNETIARRAKLQAFCGPCSQRRLLPENRSGRLGLRYRCRNMDCSHCKDCHSKPTFSVQQRQQPPEVRRCIGSYSFFRLCPHLMVPAYSIFKKAEEVSANHRERPSVIKYEEFVLGSCSQCKDLALQDMAGYERQYFYPPTLTLYKYLNSNKAQFYTRSNWCLPFCKIPEGDSLTAAFLLQKQEEFRNRYGNWAILAGWVM